MSSQNKMILAIAKNFTVMIAAVVKVMRARIMGKRRSECILIVHMSH